MYNEKTRIRFSHELFKSSSFVLFVRTSNIILILFTKHFITVKHIFESVTDRKA